MKILVVADPQVRLNRKIDTGLSMAQEALRRGHEVYWATDRDVSFEKGVVRVNAQKIYGKSSPLKKPLTYFQSVWIRKDPPFDDSYVTLCWLLALHEKEILMINRPSLLLRYHEKMLPFEAEKAGFLKKTEVIPTWMFGSGKGERMKGKCITKPWLGHGGLGVRLHKFQTKPAPQALLQPFLKGVVTNGDRRVFFLNGKYAGDYVRLPAPGKIVANLNQGARPVLRPMSKKEKDICRRLGKFLGSTGILLAGADIIDERVSEINITAPTSFNVLRDLAGIDLDRAYVDFVEKWF